MPNEVHGDLAEKLQRMAEMSFKDRVKINKAGMEPFRKAFVQNFNTSFKDGHGKSIISTLTEHTSPGGRVEIGFSKAGKKAYLARFQNDGWVPHNQYGGPYKYHPDRKNSHAQSGVELPIVPGKHFWEHTYNDETVIAKITEAEVAYFERHLKDKAGR